MQYQIQQIRQHISSIDRKFHPVPAFVVTRPLFACRSLSPSFYRLSSKTTISPLSYSLVKMNPTPIRENKYTFRGTDCPPSRETPISDLNDIKLTKVNSTHEKIMSESQERFYQKKRQSNINNNSTERVSHQNQSPQQFKILDMPKELKKEQQLFPQENSKQNQNSKNKEGHIHKNEQLQQYCEQQTSKEVFNIYNQKQDKQKISSNQDKNDIEQEIKELPEVSYRNEAQQQQQSGIKLWACNPNDSQRNSAGGKSNQKRSSRKSPLKTPKSPKKQHIIYYNQIFLYKPRENNKQNSSKLSYNSSSKYISPRRQSKQISYILTTPSKRNTRAPQQSNEDEEIEIINLAPEFSKLI